MSWGAAGTSAPALADYLAMNQVNHLLGFNESDNCFDQSGQYGNPKLCNVPTAVELYKNLQKVGLRLGSPATREEGAQNTNGWLNQFITECEEASIRIDFVALHWYDWESSPLNNRVVPASQIFRRFKRYLSNAYHRHRKPLWITEFNANRHRSTEIQNEFLELALPYLESIGYVERYSYFQPNGGAGDFFGTNQSGIPIWRFFKPSIDRKLIIESKEASEKLVKDYDINKEKIDFLREVFYRNENFMNYFSV